MYHKQTMQLQTDFGLSLESAAEFRKMSSGRQKAYQGKMFKCQYPLLPL